MSSEDHRRFYLRTFGCQMNEYDSELLSDQLISTGWQRSMDPSQSSLIIYNTCSVREKAEQRVLAHIAGSAAFKRKNPEIRLAVIGCMAERIGKKLLDSCPEIDFVLGPDFAFRLPELASNGFKQTEVFIASEGNQVSFMQSRSTVPAIDRGISAFVAISKGCENYCSYCIVPYVRGPVRNRNVSDIAAEVRQLVSIGVKEFTLLGQNVNSYYDGGLDFPDLLREISEIKGVARVRFTTSHPKDVSEKLFRVMSDIPQLCEALHLPLQSGSDRILQLMNRGYTNQQYKESIDLAREIIPGLCLTTDLIAGFPSETEEDFQMTLEAVSDIGFDAAFMFRYSKRPRTAAAKLEDSQGDEVRLRRLNKLISWQQQSSHQRNQRLVGEIVEVMIDGVSRKNDQQHRGKDRGGRIVIVRDSEGTSIGDIIDVRVIRAESWTLIGEKV